LECRETAGIQGSGWFQGGGKEGKW